MSTIEPLVVQLYVCNGVLSFASGTGNTQDNNEAITYDDDFCPKIKHEMPPEFRCPGWLSQLAQLDGPHNELRPENNFQFALSDSLYGSQQCELPKTRTMHVSRLKSYWVLPLAQMNSWWSAM